MSFSPFEKANTAVPPSIKKVKAAIKKNCTDIRVINNAHLSQFKSPRQLLCLSFQPILRTPTYTHIIKEIDIET